MAEENISIEDIEEPEPTSGLDDITEVSKNDIMGGEGEDLDDITQVSTGDILGSQDNDISDVVNVSDDDLMGERSVDRQQIRIAPKGKRVVRRFPEPPASFRGIQ